MVERAGPQPFRAWCVTWFAYATYYMGRKSLSVSKKTLSSSLGLSEEQLGLIDSLYLAAYCVGQFGSGWLGDRIGARRLVGIGLFGSALACALFGAASGALAFGALYFVNGLFQATGWPGTARAMAEWTTPENRGTVMAFWSTCYQVGGIAANWVAGALLVSYGWRSTFYGPALLLALMGGTVLLLLAPGPHAAELARASPAGERAAVRKAQLVVLKSAELWSYGGCYFFIKFIRYALLFWLPYYLSTTRGYPGDVAAWVSSAFEIGGVAGVIGLGMYSDRARHIPRARLSALSLLGLALALFAYTPLSAYGVTANSLSLAAIGALLFGPDALLSGAAAQDAGGPHAAAAATGLVNGVGSIGGMVAGLAVPQLSRSFGWNALFPSLVGLAVLSAVMLVPGTMRVQRGQRGD
ncbi:MAG: MFS transporter [Myxococcota bacterium]|nr:MFS transporter [Myxococcota bacterium]